MTASQWKYTDSTKTIIYRTASNGIEMWSIDSDVYKQLQSEGYQFQEPDPEPVLPPPPPTVVERLEAAEQLIDMLLEDTDG